VPVLSPHVMERNEGRPKGIQSDLSGSQVRIVRTIASRDREVQAGHQGVLGARVSVDRAGMCECDQQTNLEGKRAD